MELVLMLRHLFQGWICIISGRDVCLGNIVLNVKACWARHLIFCFISHFELLSCHHPLFAVFEGLGRRNWWCELWSECSISKCKLGRTSIWRWMRILLWKNAFSVTGSQTQSCALLHVVTLMLDRSIQNVMNIRNSFISWIWCAVLTVRVPDSSVATAQNPQGCPGGWQYCLFS